jgi:pimeloyl-ACP methyl ester carboxylesterase
MSPPRSLVLVHGAGSGPWVFDGWVAAFPGIQVAAVDLQAGLDVASASMDDYADRVVAATEAAEQPVALCGWSMGGLVVLQAAVLVRPHSVVVIEPSPPAEIQGVEPGTGIELGTFDPEAVYGPFPAGMAARSESLPARAERKRGISVPSLRCRSLVISGSEFGEERGRCVAELYGSEWQRFPELNHWELVLTAEPRGAIARFLAAGEAS